MLKVHPDSLKSGRIHINIVRRRLMRHIQLLLRIYLIIKYLVISIIPAMIVIHQSTHMMKNIIRTIIHMLPMAVIGMHLLMIMRIQAVIYIIMQKVQEEILPEALL